MFKKDYYFFIIMPPRKRRITLRPERVSDPEHDYETEMEDDDEPYRKGARPSRVKWPVSMSYQKRGYIKVYMFGDWHSYREFEPHVPPAASLSSLIETLGKHATGKMDVIVEMAPGKPTLQCESYIMDVTEDLASLVADTGGDITRFLGNVDLIRGDVRTCDQMKHAISALPDDFSYNAQHTRYRLYVSHFQVRGPGTYEDWVSELKKYIRFRESFVWQLPYIRDYFPRLPKREQEYLIEHVYGEFCSKFQEAKQHYQKVLDWLTDTDFPYPWERAIPQSVQSDMSIALNKDVNGECCIFDLAIMCIILGKGEYTDVQHFVVYAGNQHTQNCRKHLKALGFTAGRGWEREEDPNAEPFMDKIIDLTPQQQRFWSRSKFTRINKR